MRHLPWLPLRNDAMADAFAMYSAAALPATLQV